MSAEESRKIANSKYKYSEVIKEFNDDIEREATSGSYCLIKKIKKTDLSCKELNNFGNYFKNLDYNVGVFCSSFGDDNIISINWVKNEKISKSEIEHIYF